jgi:hypothetical protein
VSTKARYEKGNGLKQPRASRSGAATVTITTATIITDYDAIAKRLRTGVAVINQMTREGLSGGSISINQAYDLDEIGDAMRLAADLLRRPKVWRATGQRVSQGLQTRKRVVELAQKMKQVNPSLSKSKAAQLIATTPPAPCKYDQAKKYLDLQWDAGAWRKLGSTDR